jgi:hypothetical protein
MEVFLEILKKTTLITTFVFAMMLLIEYINVQTHGEWQQKLKKSRTGQYLLSILLGATPGCLGAYTVVTLYAHNIVTFGALVGTMIATSGDEAFVMFSLFPGKALILTIIIAVLGFLTAYLTDLIFKEKFISAKLIKRKLPLHEIPECNCFPRESIISQLKNISFERTLLLIIVAFTLTLLSAGTIGPAEWNWIKITLFSVLLFSLFVVLTVPEHFLKKHLWDHVLKKHLLRIFLWTFASLLVIYFLEMFLDVPAWIHANYFTVLIIAVLIGIIPESGPHLIFVTLFANGSLPFSILLASSAVQDGHGTLPLIAESGKSFAVLKAINVLVGILIGVFGLLFNF